MQLRRIEIRNFRKLGHAVIDDIGDGLSVIVGDNEAGKSTVLSALRAVLFERHRIIGKPIERMLPYGQNVRPEVAIDFDLKGVRWRLRKGFHQRPEAELEGAGEKITGDAVEERLSELFAFTPPGKGQSKQEEHQGLYGLLWVEQGRSHQSLGVGGGRDALASALEGEVGQVIGGERGRALLSAAAERKESFWGKNDKPRGEYRLMADRLNELNAKKAALQDNLRQHDDKVAALAVREEALARHKRDERLIKAVEAVRTTKDAVMRAVDLERALDEAMLRRAGCEKDRLLAAEHRQRRIELIGKGEAAEAEAGRAASSTGDARGLLAWCQGVAEAAERRCAELRDARRRAEDRLRLLESAITWQRKTEALKKAEAQLAQAEHYAAGQREALAAAAAMTIGPKDVADLDRLQKALDQARSELRVASVQIAFEPLGQQTVAVDGMLRSGGEPLQLSRDAALDLEGFGRLVVRPGGGVDALARVADNAARKLDDRLRGLGFSAVPDARAMLTRRAEAETEVAAMGKLLCAVAPSGLDALRQAVESERVALARPLPETAMELVDAHEGAIEDAVRARDQAVLAERSAEADANDSRGAREHAARELAILEERAAGARTRYESHIAELAAARAKTSDDVLRERLADASRACEIAEAEVERARSVLAATDAALARLDLERAEAAERTIRADIEKLRSERRDLQVELGVLGRAGLGEELSETEGQIERLSRDKAAKDLEASASRLLLQTLTEAQRESKDRWLGPVRERVKPYLRFLEPDSDIVLNEQTLEIEGILRNGVSEPFQALSMGAREQVAVITRLALADILRASGQPSALILDDALVNTDEGRLERMHRVLQTAAKSLQVLVLTCRERDFVGLGDIKRL